MEDKLFWRFCKDGCFSARSFYEVLRGVGCLNFPRKAIWRVKVPNKVLNVVCDLLEVLTIGNLAKRGMVLANWCVV